MDKALIIQLSNRRLITDPETWTGQQTDITIGAARKFFHACKQLLSTLIRTDWTTAYLQHVSPRELNLKQSWSIKPLPD